LDRAIKLEATKPDADGRRIDRLAAAQYRLAQQERLLAGRPAPGSYRPKAPNPNRWRGGAVPVDELQPGNGGVVGAGEV
jgi:hypothetical protein